MTKFNKEERAKEQRRFVALGAAMGPVAVGIRNLVEKGSITGGVKPGRFLTGAAASGAIIAGLTPTLRKNVTENIAVDAEERLRRQHISESLKEYYSTHKKASDGNVDLGQQPKMSAAGAPQSFLNDSKSKSNVSMEAMRNNANNNPIQRVAVSNFTTKGSLPKIGSATMNDPLYQWFLKQAEKMETNEDFHPNLPPELELTSEEPDVGHWPNMSAKQRTDMLSSLFVHDKSESFYL